MMVRFRSRQLSPEEFLASSAHIATCAECRQELAAERNVAASTQFVAGGLRDRLPADVHLTYEQLKDYVDETLPQVERVRLRSHLDGCDGCRQEVSELIFLSANLASYPQAAPALYPQAAPALRQSLPQRESAFQRLANLLTARRWQLVGLAVMLLLVALAGVFVWQTRKQQQLANRNQNVQQKAPDNSIGKAPEEAHSAPGPENGTAKSEYDAIIVAAIISEQLAAAPDLKDLKGRPDTLLGDSDRMQQFELLAPRGTIVQSSRPTLHWQALTGAESYKVYVLNTKFDVLQDSGPLTQNSWTVAHPLTRGQSYVWQVVATKDGKEITAPLAPAREARFKVVDGKTAQAFEHFAQTNPDNHLALSIVCVHLGLFDDAERELKAAAASNQSPELIRKFRQELKAMRR
jgi:anti-sigma factor RsiW